MSQTYDLSADIAARKAKERNEGVAKRRMDSGHVIVPLADRQRIQAYRGACKAEPDNYFFFRGKENAVFGRRAA